MLRVNPGFIHDPWCSYCGKPLAGDDFTVDHVVPRRPRKRSEDRGYTVSCCKSCNVLKGSTGLLEFLARRRGAPDLVGRKALWRFQLVEIRGTRFRSDGHTTTTFVLPNGKVRSGIDRDLWLIDPADENLPLDVLRAKLVSEMRDLERTG